MFYTVIAGLCIGYLIIVLLVFIGQEKMLFFPLRTIEATPDSIGLKFEDLSIMTEDHVRLAGWYIPAENARAHVLFCHGNAGNISHRLDSIRIFHALGLGVLIFDYRGYGQSEGSLTEKGTYLDARAALAYLTHEKGVPLRKVVLFGRSLGAAVASEAALHNRVGALIIESGFTSVPDLGKKHYPFLPVRLLSRYRYGTLDKIGSIPVPKLFIHSPDDEIIPFEHGKRLFERASEPKAFLEIRGDHNNGFILSERAYRNGIDQFISRFFQDHLRVHEDINIESSKQ